MIATSFDEETNVLEKPPNMSVDDCEPLPVWRGLLTNGLPVTISCWKFTKEEMEEIQKTGRLWLMVLGEGMPPVHLNGISPFKK